MRAQEFIIESNPIKFNGLELSLEIQKDDEFVDDDDVNNQVVYVTASSGGKNLGQVLFTMDYDSQGLVLNPQDLEVDERYRGQGIAQTMYDFVKSKGYRIRRSGQQTDAGRGFWEKHRPEVNVWENFDDGKKPGRKGLAKRVGVDCKQSVSKLRSIAKNSSGEKQRMAHWCANMKAGKKKANEAEQTPAQKYIQDVYSQYMDWPYGKGDKVMIWGSGEGQQIAPFALTTDILDKNTVIIDWLQAVPQRQGVGRRAMAELQRQAQEYGVRLKLMPEKRGQIPPGTLKRIYSKMGFKPTTKGADLMAWQPEQLDEISDKRLQQYLSRADQHVSNRMDRMARARDRLNKGYEIYRADEPTKIVDRFEANTPAEAQRYYDNYINNYVSDVDYDLRLRRSTGIMEDQLDEGLRDWIAALAATGAMAMGAPADAKQIPAPTTSVSQQAYNQISQALATPAAQTLKKAAIKAGITGTELAQFMAQCAHESANFTSLEEFGGSLDFRKYDPKFNPRKAKQLGNKVAGDGAKYKGRGYIQLTGRDNYKRAGQALGLPLEQRPELVERPDVAAKVAVWFWQNRVAPKVASYHDTAQVTKPINPGMRGLKDRNTKFNAIKQGAMATQKDLAPRGRRI